MQRTGTRHGGIVWRKEKVRGQGFPKARRPPQLRTMGVLLLERDPVTRIGIDVRSSSPNSQPETFTVGIGQWSKVISASQILRGSHWFLSTLGLTRKTPQPSIQ